MRTPLAVAISVLAMLACAPAPRGSASPRIAPKASFATTEPASLLRAHGYEVWLDDRTGDASHHSELRAWTERAMAAVSETTGGAEKRIHVLARKGSRGAKTRGRTITLNLEDGPRPARRSSEWVLPHELIHASFPSLDGPDLWVEEGLATYLEPLVRVRAGQLAAVDMWRDLVRDLPQGAPRAGEGGLRGTRSWHRLYWQGAVFWLEAELLIDERSAGKRSLHDALCAWARLEDSEELNAERVFSVMDAALGQALLVDLYQRASERGIEGNPARLLAKLGVAQGPTFSEAPAAKLREALTRPSLRPCAR